MKVSALMLGRAGSTGFPGKNTLEVLGKPLMAYPILEARKSAYVEDLYISTDCPKISDIGSALGASIIERPPHLATATALGEDAYAHGWREICERNPSVAPESHILVLLFCNAVTVTSDLIDAGVEMLKARPELDSAVSVSKYNMWSPLRARKLDSDGLLKPFVPFEVFGDPKTLNCDRDSQGDVWFADMGVSVIRGKCLDNLDTGLLPQKWMGKNIAPIFSEAGFDLDYPWQLPQAEWWLRHRGWE